MLFNNSTGSCWRKWDLHIHSTASDGKSSPQEIIDAAIEKGLSVIALTDHHTVDNIDSIKSLGKEKGLTVISGIEFRTEYGRKSVHMIGLFPDRHNGINLDGYALKDLILAPLKLSRTHIIAEARKESPNEKDEQKLYKEGLLKVQVDFKEAADLIHKYGGLVSVHAGDKQNSFDREMRHYGTGTRDVSLADSLGPVKEELLNYYIDICEITKKSEGNFYINTWNKPVIAASDAHTTEDISRHYTWIKAEPSFEGLRQILYEPRDRVAIQDRAPEYKSDYLLIKHIRIKHNDFGEQIIPFNPGLNTIIGGRSSGKSILLGCIARLCGSNISIKKNKPEFDEYVNELVQNMSLEWYDQETCGNRKIDFFPQNHIIELASNPSEVAKIVNQLFHSDEIKNAKLAQLRKSIPSNSSHIHELFAQLKTKASELQLLRDDLSKLGNKKGIIQEIEKLNGFLTEIRNSGVELSSDDEIFYKNKKREIEERTANIGRVKRNIQSLDSIKTVKLINDIGIKSFSLDESTTRDITAIFEEIAVRFYREWTARIDDLINKQKEIITNEEYLISTIEMDSVYCRVKAAYEKNIEYAEILKRIDEENARLNSIKLIETDIVNVEDELINIKKNIVDRYKIFYNIHEEYCKDCCLTQGDVNITPQVYFKSDAYKNFVDSNFDRRGSSSQEVIYFEFSEKDKYFEFSEKLFHDLLDNIFLLKGAKSPINVAEDFLSMNPFRINYNITYQGDDLYKMSEGKIAFVILKILLDFSQSDYPILIDQPEDDLDNRAIYFELVKYLREKKKSRQIILVTHNPNIVVGADAEEIIVANQHGTNNKNPQEIKFAFYSSGLENTFQNKSEYILPSKGIREHVCEILEGGEQAFKLRENKYLFR